MAQRTAEVVLLMAPDFLRNHSQWSSVDYLYFIQKGYTPEEISALWDRDAAVGLPPHSPIELDEAKERFNNDQELY